MSKTLAEVTWGTPPGTGANTSINPDVLQASYEAAFDTICKESGFWKLSTGETVMLASLGVLIIAIAILGGYLLGKRRARVSEQHE